MVDTLGYGYQVVARNQGKRTGSPEREPKDGRLRREQWTLEALFVWAEKGLDGVTIPYLAERLGVTKGSFYWHFEGRAALIQSALDLWALKSTEQTIARLRATQDPKARLSLLFDAAFDDLEHLRMEAGIVAAALSGHENVRAHYLRVHTTRTRYVVRMFRELGLSRETASVRGVAMMGSYLGALQLALLGAPGLRAKRDLSGLRNELKRLFAANLAE